MKREDILDMAKTCVCGDREQDYGSPENNFDTIAKLWTTYLKSCEHVHGDITSEDVAVMMILLKISRIASRFSR